MVLGVFSTVMQQQSVLSQFRKHPAEVNNQMSPSAILTLLSRFSWQAIENDDLLDTLRWFFMPFIEVKEPPLT